MSFKLIKEYTNVKYYRDDSGFEICYIPTTSNKYFFSYLIKSESTNNIGIAHAVEHCILDAASTFEGCDFFNQIKNNSPALLLNATTSSDYMKFYGLTYFEEDFTKLIQYYFHFIFHAKLEKKTFKKECVTISDGNKKGKIIFNEILSYYSNIAIYTAKEAFQNVFSNSTYAFDAGGDPNDFCKITYDDVCNFYKKFFVLSNCKLFITGPVNIHYILKILEDFISKTQNQNKLLTYTSPLLPQKQKTIEKTVSVSADFQNIKILSIYMKEIKSIHDELLMEILTRTVFTSKYCLLTDYFPELFSNNRIPIPALDKESRYYILTFAVKERFSSTEEFYNQFTNLLKQIINHLTDEQILKTLEKVIKEYKFEILENESIKEMNSFSFVYNLLLQGIQTDYNLYAEFYSIENELHKNPDLVKTFINDIINNTKVTLSNITNNKNQNIIQSLLQKDEFIDNRKKVSLPVFDIKKIPCNIEPKFEINNFSIKNLDICFVDLQNSPLVYFNFFIQLKNDFNFKYISFVVDYFQEYLSDTYKHKIEIMFMIYRNADNQLIPGLHFSFMADEASGLDIFFNIFNFIFNTSNSISINDLLINRKILQISQSIFMKGMKLSSFYAMSFLNNLSALNDYNNGLSLLSELNNNKLNNTETISFNNLFTNKLYIGIAANVNCFSKFSKQIKNFSDPDNSEKKLHFNSIKDYSGDSTFLYMGKLAYPSLIFKTEGFSDKQNYPNKLILSQYLNNSYLWDNIRKKNGAYETMAFISGYEDAFGFASHMDCNPDKSIQSFISAIDFLYKNGIENKDIQNSIIRLAPIQLRQLSTSELLLHTVKNYITGTSIKDTNFIRNALINAKVDSVYETIKILKQDFDKGYRIVNLSNKA